MSHVSARRLFLVAVALGIIGKILFPQASIRVGLIAAASLPIRLALYLGDGSLLGAAIMAPISVIGSTAGVVAAKFALKVGSPPIR